MGKQLISRRAFSKLAAVLIVLSLILASSAVYYISQKKPEAAGSVAITNLKFLNSTAVVATVKNSRSDAANITGGEINGEPITITATVPGNSTIEVVLVYPSGFKPKETYTITIRFQGGEPAYSAAVFSQTWNKLIIERIVDAIQTADGGFALLSGVGGPSIPTFNYSIIKMDDFGNMLWIKNYYLAGENWYGQLYALTQTSDGGYALAGYRFSEGGYMSPLTRLDTAIIRTDDHGNILWGKTYDCGTIVDSGRKIVQTDDAGFAVMVEGTQSDPSYGFSRRICLLKVDSTGELQWKRYYPDVNNGSDPTESYAPNDMVQTENGFAMVGTYYLHGYMVYLVATDKNGNILLESRWPQNDDSSFANDYYLASTSGGYAVAGSKLLAGEILNRDFWFVKLNREGNIVLDKTWGKPGVDEQASAIVALADGGYVIAGTSYSNILAGIGTPCLVKLDCEGNVLWTQLYEAVTRDCYVSNLIQTGDGFLLVGGYGGSLGFALKVDLEGQN